MLLGSLTDIFIFRFCEKPHITGGFQHNLLNGKLALNDINTKIGDFAQCLEMLLNWF